MLIFPFFFPFCGCQVSCCVFWEFCCSVMLAGLTVRKEETCFLLIISPVIKGRKYQKRNSLELNQFWLEVQDLKNTRPVWDDDENLTTFLQSMAFFPCMLSFVSRSGCFSYCLFFWAHSLCIDSDVFKIIELALLLGKRLAMGEC